MDNVVELVKKAKKGDKEALAKLLLDHKNDYYKLAYVYLGNQEEALDALEDMTVVVCEKIGKLKKLESFSSWSKTILVNICKKNLKRRKRYLPWAELEEEPYTENYEGSVYQWDLAQHLACLKDDHGEAIKLKYLLGYDYQTIALITGVPVGTVKSRIHNGLKKLKESLGGEYCS